MNEHEKKKADRKWRGGLPGWSPGAHTSGWEDNKWQQPAWGVPMNVEDVTTDYYIAEM